MTSPFVHGGRLQGKTAIITGAASGIGRATAELFLAEGARVVLTDTAEDRLLDAFASCDDALLLAGDIADPGLAGLLVRSAVERFGALHAVCNVAGIVDRFLPTAEMDDDVWHRVISVNLTGPMMLCRAAIPELIGAGGGTIVNVASVAGLLGGRGGAAYTSAKHGLVGLTKNIAVTYVDDGIRCVAVCPGSVTTGISWGGEPSARGQAVLERTNATNRRRGVSEEVASVLLFMVSDDAAFISGAVVPVDGGWTAT